MDEQMREKFDAWYTERFADNSPLTIASSAFRETAWVAYQAGAAALSQPTAAQGDSSHSAGGECGGVPDWIETMATLAQLVYTANGNRYADINELLKKAGDLITKAKATQ